MTTAANKQLIFCEYVVWLMLCLSMTLLSGCNRGPARVLVTGKVLLDGKPLEGADVTFHPKDEQQTAYAISAENGEFKLQTIRQELGAELGSYQISISKIETPDSTGGAMPADLGSKTIKPKWLTPKRYANAETSGLEVKVEKGMGPIEFALSSQ